MKIFIFFLNLLFKCFVGWCMYLLSLWFLAPDWLMIVMIAWGVSESKITYEVTYK